MQEELPFVRAKARAEGGKALTSFGSPAWVSDEALW